MVYSYSMHPLFKLFYLATINYYIIFVVFSRLFDVQQKKKKMIIDCEKTTNVKYLDTQIPHNR